MASMSAICVLKRLLSDRISKFVRIRGVTIGGFMGRVCQGDVIAVWGWSLVLLWLPCWCEMVALDGEGMVGPEGDLGLVECCCLTLGVVEGC